MSVVCSLCVSVRRVLFAVCCRMLFDVSSLFVVVCWLLGAVCWLLFVVWCVMAVRFCCLVFVDCYGWFVYLEWSLIVDC